MSLVLEIKLSYLILSYYDFEINRPVRYRNTAKRNYFHRRQTDRRTDRRMDGRTDGQTDRRRVRQQ